MANGRTRPGRSRAGSRAPARGGTVVTGLGVAVVVAAVVGYFAYRAAADLPGVKFADQGNAAHPDRHRRRTRRTTPTRRPPGRTCPTSPPGASTPSRSRGSCRSTTWRTAAWSSSTAAPPRAPTWWISSRPIVRPLREQVILAPYPGMRTRIALTAWTRLDAFDDFDEARIVRFIRAYRGIDHHQAGRMTRMTRRSASLARAALASGLARRRSDRVLAAGRLADRAAAVPRRDRRALRRDVARAGAGARGRERAAAGGRQGLGRDLVRRLHLADRRLRRLRRGSATCAGGRGPRVVHRSSSQPGRDGATAIQVNSKMRTHAYRRGQLGQAQDRSGVPVRLDRPLGGQPARLRPPAGEGVARGPRGSPS